MLHSRQRPRARQSNANLSSREDPYAPNSAAYAERHASQVTELPGGLVRIDIGEPVKRLPCERQAVRRDAPKALPLAPVEAPPAPPAAPTAAPPVSRKEHRAITREP